MIKKGSYKDSRLQDTHRPKTARVGDDAHPLRNLVRIDCDLTGDE